MKIRTPFTNGPLQLFWRFTQETVLIAAIYIVLVCVTLVLRYFAGLEQEPNHKSILEWLEFTILIASSLGVLLVIVSLTIRLAVDVYHDLRNSLSGNEPTFSAPVEISFGEGFPASGIGKRRAWLPLIISFVVLLGMLGAWVVHKGQIEDLKQREHRQRIENERLQDTAEKNFAALCRVGGGSLGDSLTCRFQDGRVVPLRLVEPKSSEDK